jgi:predicted RNase H-like HicB family nuclease
MRYAVVIEKAGQGYSGYVPDLPGCVAAGATVEAVKQGLTEAIPFHLEGLGDEGRPVAKPESVVAWVDV